MSADLCRVVDGLAEAVALLDDPVEQTDDMVQLRQDLTAAHRLLDRVRVIVDDASGTGSGRNAVAMVAGAVAIPAALVVAVYVAALLLGDRPWWVYGLIGIGAVAVFAAATFTFRGTVRRGRAHRNDVRRIDLADLIPADYVEDVATPAADLRPSPVAKAHAHLLMSSPASRGPAWLTRVRLGQAAAALAGIPKTSRVPLLRTAPAMPAVKQLIADVDDLASDLQRRSAGRRAAEDAVSQYKRARSGLVCAYRLMSDTTDRLTAYGRHAFPAMDE